MASPPPPPPPPSDGAEYYAAMALRWSSDCPSPGSLGETWNFYRECGYADPEATLRSMIEPVHWRRGRLLDFGCDNGLMLDFFRRSAPGDVGGYGVDINRVAIGRARERFPESEFRVSDGLTVPFGDKYFDLAVVIATVKHVRYEDRERLYRELNRIADYVLIIEADEKEEKPQGFKGWTFYNSHFEREFRDNFARVVKVVKEGGDILGLYQCRSIE